LSFRLDNARKKALLLEAEGKEDLNFSCNILVLGKTGVGKSATINSIFGEEKSKTDAFNSATTNMRQIIGDVDGVKIRIIDTPGLRPSVMDQGSNKKIFAAVKKYTKRCPPDIVLYVDRLDSISRDFNDLPLLKTITAVLGSSIWFNAIVALTHAASAPPEGLNCTTMTYEVLMAQRSHIIQQSIRQAAGDCA
jgi:Toc86/159 family protein import component